MTEATWRLGMFALGLLVVVHAARDSKSRPTRTEKANMETTQTQTAEKVEIPPQLRATILARMKKAMQAAAAWLYSLIS